MCAIPSPRAVTVDAATVVLARDRSLGPEVLLLERSGNASFAAGASVFPGGVVDAEDHSFPFELVVGPPIAWWLSVYAEDSATAMRAILVAALRETFEEAGVLLANTDAGDAVSVSDLREAQADAVRNRLTEGDHRSWVRWLKSTGFRLDAGRLVPWSWWINPPMRRRRFDTRFFVARAPEGQIARADGHETIAATWMRPNEALERFANGKLHLFPPTAATLRQVAAHGSVTAVQAASPWTPDVQSWVKRSTGSDRIAPSTPPMRRHW